jgi:uncharacterized membrane protein
MWEGMRSQVELIVGVILWIVVIVQAFRGQTFKVPVVGDLAEKYANNA